MVLGLCKQNRHVSHVVPPMLLCSLACVRVLQTPQSPLLQTVLHSHSYVSNCTLAVTGIKQIPVAVDVPLCSLLQVQEISFKHICCCQSLAKGNGRRQTATPTRGMNRTMAMQVSGIVHLPEFTSEFSEVGIL